MFSALTKTDGTKFTANVASFREDQHGMLVTVVSRDGGREEVRVLEDAQHLDLLILGSE